jgi:hypothetical protein
MMAINDSKGLPADTFGASTLPQKGPKRPQGVDDKQVPEARDRQTSLEISFGSVISQAACFHLSCNFSDGSARGVTR